MNNKVGQETGTDEAPKRVITECEVCQRLMKEKHRNDYVWKVLCVCFLAIAVILAILYFTSGAIKTETNITIDSTDIGNNIQGDGSIDGDNNIVIGGEEGIINGTVEQMNYTPIICITVIMAAVILVVGGIAIANNNKKDD